MIKIGILGACGRMGANNILNVMESEELELVFACDAKTNDFQGKDICHFIGGEKTGVFLHHSIEQLSQESQVVIDFSSPSATMELLPRAITYRTALVIGTTGYSDREINLIKEASEKIPIILSGNYSTGINLLLSLVQKAAKSLPKAYNIEIVEQHHNQKVDAPSGTALMLGEAAAQGRNLKLNEVINTNRNDNIGKRKEEEIGIFALRGGGIIGDHRVFFMGKNERIELAHLAQTRKAFSDGVINACKWISQKEKGFYNMLDVIGIK